MTNSCTYSWPWISILHVETPYQAYSAKVMEPKYTCALAHSNKPPIGAKIMPIAKKRGRTVFGVRIGLDSRFSFTATAATTCVPERSTHCQAFSRCCRKAVSIRKSQAVSAGSLNTKCVEPWWAFSHSLVSCSLLSCLPRADLVMISNL